MTRLPAQRVTAVALSIVPGLGHWYLGEKGAGLLLGMIWLLPLLLAVYCRNFAPNFFLSFASIFWMILMSIHGIAIFSAARPGRYCKSGGELWRINAMLLILVLMLYLTAGYIIQNFLTVWIEVWVPL
jgi:hypothetical protein